MFKNLLDNSLIIPPIRAIIRPLFFSDNTDYYGQILPYRTDGGTIFIVKHRKRFFGITAKHAIFPGGNYKQYQTNNLMVFEDYEIKRGSRPASVNFVAFGTGSEYEAEDIAVVSFTEEQLFEVGTYYDLDVFGFCQSVTADRVQICGFSKDLLNIDYSAEAIYAHVVQLEMTNIGNRSHDATISEACGTFPDYPTSTTLGLSGSPVFNLNSGSLCGMVLRGGKHKNVINVYYSDFRHIWQVVYSIAEKLGSR